jgi:hypothetical protein
VLWPLGPYWVIALVTLPSAAVSSVAVSRSVPSEAVRVLDTLKPPSEVFSPVMVRVDVLPLGSVMVMVVVNDPSALSVVVSFPTSVPLESVMVAVEVVLPSAFFVSVSLRVSPDASPLSAEDAVPLSEDNEVNVPVDMS